MHTQCTHTHRFKDDEPKINNVIYSMAERWKATHKPWWRKWERKPLWVGDAVDIKTIVLLVLGSHFPLNLSPQRSLPLIFQSQSASWTWNFCHHNSVPFGVVFLHSFVLRPSVRSSATVALFIVHCGFHLECLCARMRETVLYVWSQFRRGFSCWSA